MTKYIKNVQASIRSRLQNKAKETNRPFSEVYVDQFILKGALMFTVWQVTERRATLDIDFLARFDNQIATIEKVIKAICKISVISDGLTFDSETVKGQKIKEDADYEGVRVKFCGFLERSRIPMQVDIGFGDIVYPQFEVIDYPVILDLPNPHIKGYPAESVISEKFEAMVKLGLLNSRMKDFYDIWLMIHNLEFNTLKLGEALKRTFEHRKTSFPPGKLLFDEEIYDEKSDRQKLWKAFLKRGDIPHAPEKLYIIAREIEEFLRKPLDAVNKRH
jgi:hypothetical protein